MLLTGKGKRDLFQSTLPGWGATRIIPVASVGISGFQSTLPGWGATGPSLRYATAQVTFQSTLPGWGATAGQIAHTVDQVISIHAPRVGSDRTGDRHQMAR